MRESTRDELKGMTLVLGLFAALCLMVLCVQRFGDRLPKEQGVGAYLSVGDTEPRGSSFIPLSQGGCSHGITDDSVWRSVSRYQEVRSFTAFDYCVFQPLSIWIASGEMETGSRTRIFSGADTAWFAFETKGKTKIESFSVKRWPIGLAGTDAVKADSWAGREDVDYSWRKGGLFGLSKGNFAVEPGYLYSIFVFWKSSEKPGQGWTEFSFITETAPQSGNDQ